ncbi:MAG: hypothetical protein IBJ18_09620 [Phycisphaerales bacterium]|nr:hypothetical protein [Phycisphaerales bacterium]
MKPDYLSYSRATSVAVLGLVIQLLMGIGLLIYSVLGKDHTATSGAYAVLLGAAVWLILAIVFDQHRRERIEALEAEQLDSAQGGSVFASSGDELKVAARRLAWMHKFLVPGFSVLLAIVLLALAYWRINDASGRMTYDKAGLDQFIKPPNRGWAIAVGLGLGVVGFIFARFVSGMAKQKVWANLRGGAAYAVLASVIGLAMSAGHFTDMAGRDDVLRYLQIIIPGLAGFLGIEIFVNLLLNLYRPRKPGEVPRAAFDSPVLGFVASPDRIAKSIGGAISYQVGIDVTGTWAYKLVARTALPLLLMGAAVIWLLTCVAVVDTNERGIRVRNGTAYGALEPGLYFKLPWPFESIDRTPVTDMREVELATPAAPADVKALLWTNDHKVKETYAVLRAARAGTVPGATQANAVGGSTPSAELALIAVRVPMRYRISDVEKWERFATPSTREDLVKSMAQREVMLELARYNDEEIIGAGRAKAGEQILKRVQASFDSAEAGIEVLYAGIESVHPQKEVATEFEKIVQGKKAREELVETGRTQAIQSITRAVGSLELGNTIAKELRQLEKLTREKAEAKLIAEQTAKVEQLIISAGGEAASTLATARATRWAKHMRQRGQALAYGGRLAAFNANPTLYKAQLYFDMLKEELADSRVYIVPDNKETRVRINAEETGSGGNVFTSDAPK